MRIPPEKQFVILAVESDRASAIILGHRLEAEQLEQLGRLEYVRRAIVLGYAICDLI